MSTERANESLALTRTQAAELCQLTPSGFDTWVRKGIVPPAILGTRRWSRVALKLPFLVTWRAQASRHSSSGKQTMRMPLKGINTVRKKLADGKINTHYYHRATGTKLTGKPGTAAFQRSFMLAEASMSERNAGTLSAIIRDFSKTAKWRRLAASTQSEYRRILTFWEDKYSTVSEKALQDKAFRKHAIKWHDEFSQEKPREADNRLTILARVLSWAATDGDLKVKVLDSFERAYTSDRADKIWLPEHVNAFLSVADDEMKLAMILALHTGQRQADLRKMAWSQYDGAKIVLRQRKSTKAGVEGRMIQIPCTAALKATLDSLPRRGALIMLTKTEKAFQKRYFAERWSESADLAIKISRAIADLNFHDIRGTTVTMLLRLDARWPKWPL